MIQSSKFRADNAYAIPVIAAVGLVALLLTSGLTFSLIADRIDGVAEASTPAYDQLTSLQNLLRNFKSELASAISLNDVDSIASAQRIDKRIVQTLDEIQKYAFLSSSDIELLLAVYQEYSVKGIETTQLLLDQATDGLDISVVTTMNQQFEQSMRLLARLKASSLHATSESLDQARGDGRRLMLIGGVIAIFFILVIGWLTLQLRRRTADLEARLARASQQADTVSSTLNESISVQGASLGEAADAVSVALSQLDEVRQSAERTQDSATMLTTVANDGDQVVLKSSTQIATIASRIGDMSGTIYSIKSGLSDFLKALANIDVIASSVQELADQSKVLSINAAIEAAQAGEQGKGFTVVSRSIRELSLESHSAANNIRQIINEIDTMVKALEDKISKGSEEADYSLEELEKFQLLFGTVQQASANTKSAGSTIENATIKQEMNLKEAGSLMGSVVDAMQDANRQFESMEHMVTQLKEYSHELKSASVH